LRQADFTKRKSAKPAPTWRGLNQSGKGVPPGCSDFAKQTGDFAKQILPRGEVNLGRKSLWHLA